MARRRIDGDDFRCSARLLKHFGKRSGSAAHVEPLQTLWKSQPVQKNASRHPAPLPHEPFVGLAVVPTHSVFCVGHLSFHLKTFVGAKNYSCGVPIPYRYKFCSLNQSATASVSGCWFSLKLCPAAFGPLGLC